VKSKLKLVGRAEVKVIGKDGRVRWTDGKLNLITNVGLAGLAGLFNGASVLPFKYIGLGMGTNPADAADVALEDEVDFGGGERKLADSIDQVTDVITDDTSRIIATFDISQDFTLSEIGMFDSLAGGVLGAHRVFVGQAITAGESVVVTWTLTLAAA